jgi:hypothetical protein
MTKHCGSDSMILFMFDGRRVFATQFSAAMTAFGTWVLLTLLLAAPGGRSVMSSS